MSTPPPTDPAVTAPPSASAPGAGRRRTTWRRVRRALLVAVVAVALVTGLGGYAVYRHLDGNLTHLDVTGDLGARPDQVADGEPVNVLIMGSDSRAGAEGRRQLREGGARSDTTILLHLSSDRTFAYGVSLPRDAMVERPACRTPTRTVPAESPAMFNSAFALGGVGCTVKTVESLTGVRVDHWVVVDFNGFEDMVDAVGGVDVCVPEAVDDDRYDMHLAAGQQTITGAAALDYVRVRHGLGDGSDIGRMKRQQAFVASMAAKLVTAGTLARPDRVVRFLDAATASLTLDEGVGNVLELAQLGGSFREIGLDRIRFVTVPWEAYAPDPNRLQWDAEAADRLWARVRHDRPLPRSLQSGAVTAHQQARPASPAVPASAAATARAQSDGLCA